MRGELDLLVTHRQPNLEKKDEHHSGGLGKRIRVIHTSGYRGC